MSHFLVTGRPRSRTAWIAALLSAHGAPCCHEATVQFERSVTLPEIFAAGYQGISDPGAALYYRETLELYFSGRPTVFIDRNAGQARSAFARWLGQPVGGWDRIEDSLRWFQETFSPMVVHFDDLEDPAIVDAMVRHLIGRPLDRRIFDTFSILRIEQHREKARAAMAEACG